VTVADFAAPASRRRWSVWPWFALAVAASWVALIAHHLSSAHHTSRPGIPTAVAMWMLMSVAMMAPTAVPVLRSLHDILRSTSSARWWWFLGGYLTVWLGFAVGAGVVQWVLQGAGAVGVDGVASNWWAGAALVVAGAYQFTSWKQACLRECVSPMTFFLRHWRDGSGGAVRMGLRHGSSCLGCCWALMLLAFVGGLGSIWFMVLSAVLMATEKLPSLGRRVTVPLGVALLVVGVLTLVLPASSPSPSHDQHGRGLRSFEGKELSWTSGTSMVS
jgi:predicted metal-binding membrane protein